MDETKDVLNIPEEQRAADNWMCKHLNKILNNISGYDPANLARVIGKINVVMMLANRRIDEEGSFDRMYFDDTDRATYGAGV